MRYSIATEKSVCISRYADGSPTAMRGRSPESLTVTEMVSVCPPAAAVIVAVPTPCATASPPVTVTTDSSLLDQVSAEGSPVSSSIILSSYLSSQILSSLKEKEGSRSSLSVQAVKSSANTAAIAISTVQKNFLCFMLSSLSLFIYRQLYKKLRYNRYFRRPATHSRAYSGRRYPCRPYIPRQPAPQRHRLPSSPLPRAPAAGSADRR